MRRHTQKKIFIYFFLSFFFLHPISPIQIFIFFVTMSVSLNPINSFDPETPKFEENVESKQSVKDQLKDKFQKLGVVASRYLMLSDIVSDLTVTAQLGEKNADGNYKHPRFFLVSIALLLSQYFFIWLFLWRPFLKMKNEKRWPTWSIVIYGIFGIPGTILGDLVLCTRFIMTDLDKHQYLMFYERLRTLLECTAESIPAAIFQIYLNRGHEDISVSHTVLVISITVAIISLLRNLYSLNSTAKKIGLGFFEFLQGVAAAGVGSIPYNAIASGRVVSEIRLLFELSSDEVHQLVEAMMSPKSKIKTVILK